VSSREQKAGNSVLDYRRDSSHEYSPS